MQRVHMPYGWLRHFVCVKAKDDHFSKRDTATPFSFHNMCISLHVYSLLEYR